jgi:hypothetical protein
MASCGNVSDDSENSNNHETSLTDTYPDNEYNKEQNNEYEDEEYVSPYKNAKIINVKNDYEFGEKITVFPQISETILYDTDKYKISAKSIEYDELDCKINLTFENKTNESVSFYNEYFFINEWKIGDTYQVGNSVGPNSSKDFRIDFALYDLKLRHIDVINSISFIFTIEFENTEMLVLRTDAKDKDKSYIPKGEVVYDKNGVKAILPNNGCMYENGFYIYVENNTDEPMYVINHLAAPNNEVFSHECRGTILLPHTKDIYPSRLELYEIKNNDLLEFSVSASKYDLKELEASSEVEGEYFRLKVVD